jgi:hypothetical protein
MTNLDAEEKARLEFAAAQAEEYGTFVANGPIYYDGVLAFSKGHAVPKSHVEKYKHEDQGLVSRVKKADQAAVQPGEVVVNTAKKG